MNRHNVLLLIMAACLFFLGFAYHAGNPNNPAPSSLASVAVRVHSAEAMTAFYSQAFGISFREVDARGIRSWFGEYNGITLKFVPLRESGDFENYPSHQLGFRVADVQHVIDLAEKYGGRQEGPMLQTAVGIHAAVRDPDGNTLELYGSK